MPRTTTTRSASSGAAKMGVRERVPTHGELKKEMDLVVMGRKTFESVLQICAGHTGKDNGDEKRVGKGQDEEWNGRMIRYLLLS
jgi:hypothetical protein